MLFPLWCQAQNSRIGSSSQLTKRFSGHPSIHPHYSQEGWTSHLEGAPPPLQSKTNSAAPFSASWWTEHAVLQVSHGSTYRHPHPIITPTPPPSSSSDTDGTTKGFLWCQALFSMFYMCWLKESSPQFYYKCHYSPTLYIRVLRCWEVGARGHSPRRWQSRTAPGAVPSSTLPYLPTAYIVVSARAHTHSDHLLSAPASPRVPAIVPGVW